MQIHLRVVEPLCRYRALGHLKTVDEQLRLVLTTSHHGRHVLPLVHANGARARLHRAVGGVVRIRRFDAQYTLVVRHVEIPSVRPAVFAETNNTALPQLRGSDPRGHGEFAVTHVHHRIARHHHCVIFAVKIHSLAKRTLHKLRATHQLAVQTFRAPHTVRIAIQLPRAYELIVQLRRIRLHLSVGRCLQKHIRLVQPRLGNLDRARPHRALHAEHAFGWLGPRRAALQQKGIRVLRGLHAHAEFPVLGQLAQRDFEIRAWPIRAGHLPNLRTGNRRSQQQTIRRHLMRLAQRIALGATHAGKHRVINAVVLAPAAHRAVALITLVEAPLCAHLERLKGKWLGRHQLCHHEVIIGQQRTVRAEDQPVRARLRVDLMPEIHPEILNHRLGLRIHNRQVQRPLGNLEIRFHQQWREQHRLPVVHETVLGHTVRRQHAR